MASSEFDLGTYCSVLNILNHRLSKVVLYLIFVVLMMRRDGKRRVVLMLQLVVLNEQIPVFLRANTQFAKD